MDDIMQIAQQGAQYFLAKRPFAQYHAPDLMQEAVLAVLDAERTHDPKQGPLDKYCYRAVVLALQRYWGRVRDDSLHKRSPSERRLARAYPKDGEDPLLHVPSPSALSPAAQAEGNELAERIRDLLRPLDPSWQKFGLTTGLGLGTAGEVAREAAVPVAAVYRARKVMTRKAQESPAVKALYEEIR